MGINPLTPQTCFECHGSMVKPYPVHSYDFNKEGYVPKYCVDCGICSDIEELIPETNIIAKLSNRFKKKVLKILCNHGKFFDYQTFNILFSSVKDMNLYSPFEFAEKIKETADVEKISMDFSVVVNVIYTHVDFNSMC